MDSGSRPSIGMIWAQTPSGVIGSGGTMPWNVPEDMVHFRTLTSGHPVIMGRRTWESFPEQFRPLPGRTNFVLTATGARDSKGFPDGSVLVTDGKHGRALEKAIELARNAPGSEQIWIIGGGQVYAQAMELADLAVVTIIDSEATGDTFAPALDASWTMDRMDPASGWHESSRGERYRFTRWRR